MTYKQRTSADITIARTDERGLSVGLASVPITPNARRKFHLMQEDSITLVFSLAEPIHFMAGDFIVDELFGRFLLKEEQMPTYNTTTAGYDYSLQFVSDYWVAENYICMYVYGSAITGKTDERRETTWNFTGKLSEHARYIALNYNLIGIKRLNGDGLLEDVTLAPYLESQSGWDDYFADGAHPEMRNALKHARESKYLSYNGTGIISALNMIAEAFSCEWWFVGNVLYFGKCGADSDTSYTFRLGYNVESMNISKNQNTYANRLYVLGGTNNIPESYGRKLLLDINVHDMSDGLEIFGDSGKAVTSSMLANGQDSPTLNTKSFVGSTTITQDGNTITLTSQMDFIVGYASYVQIYGIGALLSIICPPRDNGLEETVLTSVVRVIKSNTVVVETNPVSRSEYWEGDNTKQTTFTAAGYAGNASVDLQAGRYTLELVITVKVPEGYTAAGIAARNETYGRLEYEQGGMTRGRVMWNDVPYNVIFNPLLHPKTSPLYGCFVFEGGTPQGFSLGQQVELLDYIPSEIPFSWYSEDFDNPASVFSLGERRLRLPSDLPECENGYLQYKELSDRQVIEKQIRVDSIYPKCWLKITSVESSDEREYEEHSDGSKTKWVWKRYTIEVSQVGGEPFDFRESFIRNGDKLQFVFSSDTDIDKIWNEYDIDSKTADPDFIMPKLSSLAGMTFDANYDGYGKFTVIRNEDYGAKLPNEKMFPEVGDVLVLTGWDVKCMEWLGLVATAENELYQFGADYLDAIEEGQFTFECRMMSEWPFLLFGGHDWDDEPMHDSNDLRFQTENGNGHEDFHVRLGKSKWGYIPFRDTDARQMLTKIGSQQALSEEFWVRNTEYYIIPTEGAKVDIEHGALLQGVKHSRILGYELKLDYPYDTPTYSIGETDAYSRLKELEKRITN